MTYQVKQTSVTILIVSTFLAIGIGALAVLPIEGYVIHQKSQNVFLLMVGIFVIPFLILYPLAIYVPLNLSSVNVELCITSKGVEQRWLQQFLFKKQQDRVIAWSEIDEYVFQHDYRYDHFRLYLHDGTVLHVVHNHEHYKDDFKVFVKDFVQKVEEQNAVQNGVDIRKGRKDHVWEIRAMTIGLVFFAVFMPFVLLNPKNPIPVPKYIMLWGMYVFVLFVLYKSIQRLKKDV